MYNSTFKMGSLDNRKKRLIAIRIDDLFFQKLTGEIKKSDVSLSDFIRGAIQNRLKEK